MPSAYSPTPPSQQQIRLQLLDNGVTLKRWSDYSFGSNFLTPSDGWSFTVGDKSIGAAQLDALRIGSRVQLFVDAFPVAYGYIDCVDIDADRSRGIVYSIHGRDRLAPVVDAVADPRAQFPSGTTLADFLEQTLAPFGWTADDFILNNDTNRDAKTGGIRGTPMTKGGKKKGPRPLKDFTLHQLKPHNHEGLFRFIQRVLERFGLWMWPSADGSKLIVSKPNFEQPPRYQLRRLNDGSPGHNGGTNILSGTVRYDGTDQPSVIIADGYSGGGEFGRGKIKNYCVNPYFGVDGSGFVSDDVAKLLSKYPEADPVLFVTQPFKRRAQQTPFRPMFLHDEESKTQEELNFFTKRTMSELLRKSMTCNYTVEGHGQTVNGAFTPWDIDTVVDVQDDVGDVHERMYVLARTFDKSRTGGTFTKLELVRLYSIASGTQQPKPGYVDNTKIKDAVWKDGRLVPRG